jgi:hypothetical protein
MERVPEATGDEESGEREKDDDASPSGLGEIAEHTHGWVGGLQATAVVEDEYHKDGDAAQAV